MVVHLLLQRRLFVTAGEVPIWSPGPGENKMNNCFHWAKVIDAEIVHSRESKALSKVRMMAGQWFSYWPPPAYQTGEQDEKVESEVNIGGAEHPEK